MKNCQKIELARKQAGIADDIRTESFVGWKRAGFSVRKGEKAVFSVKLSKPNGSGGFKTETDHFFTEKQVEPITAKPSRRGKDTAPVSEPAPAVAVPSVAPVVTEPTPAPVALAPVVPVVAPANPTRPLIKAGDDRSGTYFGLASDGSLVTIATYETHDLTIERVDPSVPVQTEPAPAVVDAPADPDPVEEEPAPVESVEEEDAEPVLSDHLKMLLRKSATPFAGECKTVSQRLVTELKRDEIRSMVACFGRMYNEYLEKEYFEDMERLYTRDGIAPQTADRWLDYGFKLKKDAVPCHTYRRYYALTKTGTDILASSKFIDTRKITGIELDTVNYYAWDQVERA